MSTKVDLESKWSDLVDGPIEEFVSFFATNSLSEYLSIRFDFKGVVIFRCGCRVTARNYFRRKDGRVITKLIPKKGDRFKAHSVRAVAVDASFELREEWSKYATVEFLQRHSARDFMTSGQFIEVLADEDYDPFYPWWVKGVGEYDFDISSVSGSEQQTLTEIDYVPPDGNDFDFHGTSFPALDRWVENEAQERIDLGNWEHVDIDLEQEATWGTLYEPRFDANRLSSEHDLSFDLSVGLSGHDLHRSIAESDVSRLTTVFSVSD